MLLHRFILQQDITYTKRYKLYFNRIFLSINVDNTVRYLFMSHIGFGFNKEAKNKRSSSDKICSPIRERSPKLYTVFPSYVFPYTYCHISENDYTHRHICFLSQIIIQLRITKRLYNNHKDFTGFPSIKDTILLGVFSSSDTDYRIISQTL